MSFLVLKTTTSDPFAGYADCECAVVEATSELLRLVESRIRIARTSTGTDAELSELVFLLGYEPAFFDNDLVCDCCDADSSFEERFQAAEWALLPETISLTGYVEQRIECGQMHVRVERCPESRLQFAIAWSCIPKHTELTITTAAVPWAAFRQAAQGAPL